MTRACDVTVQLHKPIRHVASPMQQVPKHSNGGNGIDISGAACDNNVVVSNSLAGNTGASYNDSGTGTESGHNKV